MVENALVFASIIVGVAVTDELVSLHRLLRMRKRVRWDWAILAVALLILLTIVQIWWSIAQPDPRPWTIARFLPLLVELILLFLLASAALPDEVPDEGIDLRTYYDENGSYIWSLFALALGWLIVAGDIGAVAAGGPLFQILANQLVEFVILVVMVSLIFLRKRWWHAVALVLLASGPIGWLSRSLG